MIFYIYDENTKEYIGTQNAFIDPLETKKQGKNVYLIPQNSTEKEPPKTEKNQAVIFNSAEWEVVADYRGKPYYIGTKQHEMKELGDLPKGATFEPIEPIKTQEEQTLSDTQQAMTDTSNRIAEIKDELITAVLLDDTETLTALKSEYKELMEDA